jgi:hypothetical protein
MIVAMPSKPDRFGCELNNLPFEFTASIDNRRHNEGLRVDIALSNNSELSSLVDGIDRVVRIKFCIDVLQMRANGV